MQKGKDEAPTDANSWTANQRKFMAWLALPSMERMPPSQQALAVELGVHESTVSKWRKLPGFDAEVQQIIKENLGDVLHDVVYAFKQEAAKGSYQHQKMYFEMLGMYVPKIAPTNPEGTEAYAGTTDADLVAKAAGIIARRTGDPD